MSSSSMFPPRSLGNNNNNIDPWRRYGEERRRHLMQEDEKAGGMDFHINGECPLQRYLDLSARVLAQFRSLCDNLDRNLEDAYVMGHRLQSFLEAALPQHPDYEPHYHARELIVLRERLHDIALKIDEQQLNVYMDREFEPVCLDDEDDSSSLEEPAWESFGEDFPDVVETDASSCELLNSSDEDGDPLYLFDIEPTEEEYTLNEPVLASNFLKRISREAVSYETDSEAVDSWAQDGNSAATASSGAQQLMCDPARLAFKSIMSKLPRLESLHDPPPPPPPVNSPADGKWRSNVIEADLAEALRELHFDFEGEEEL